MVNALKKVQGLVPFFFICSFLIATTLAQETLLPYHWSQQYIDYFQSRGWLTSLSPIDRPYSRLNVAKALLEEDWENHQLSSGEKSMLQQLFREFAPEIQLLAGQHKGRNRWRRLLQQFLQKIRWEFFPQQNLPSLKVGTFTLFHYQKQNSPAGKYSFHTQLGIFWQEHLTLYQNLKVFNFADTGYIGKKFRGIYAYGEQAYLAYCNNWLWARFGRDFLQIGPGKSGQLLISDNSRPFDMYYIRLGTSNIYFSFWGFLLNKRTNKQTGSNASFPYANRFLNGHRLSLHWKQFYIGISEVILYGGPRAQWDLSYMNPFLPYYGHLVNGPGTSGNVFLNLDWSWNVHPNWRIYGEFLLDDFQVDRKEPADLEPNELGFLAGAQFARPFFHRPLLLNLEYVQIRNRTYNAPENDWEKYLHRNRVIGYYLGNNLEHYFFRATLWPARHWQAQVRLSLIRQGEGSVQGEFNKDYLNYTVEQGYHEPFPFGIVQKHLLVEWQLRYYLRTLLWVSLTFRTNSFRNYQHISGQSYRNNEIWFSLWLSWNHVFRSWRWE